MLLANGSKAVQRAIALVALSLPAPPPYGARLRRNWRRLPHIRRALCSGWKQPAQLPGWWMKRLSQDRRCHQRRKDRHFPRQGEAIDALFCKATSKELCSTLLVILKKDRLLPFKKGYVE